MTPSANITYNSTDNYTFCGATPTPGQISYLSGVTSDIQTQIASCAPKASPTFTGTVLVSLPGGTSPVVINFPTCMGFADDLCGARMI